MFSLDNHTIFQYNLRFQNKLTIVNKTEGEQAFSNSHATSSFCLKIIILNCF